LFDTVFCSDATLVRDNCLTKASGAERKFAMVGLRRGTWSCGRWLSLALLLGGLFLTPAWAVIEALTSLEKFVADADLILVASVKQLDLEQGRLVLAVEASLKGSDAVKSLPVKLAGNANEALAGVSQGDSAVLFISRGAQQDLAYGYVEGAWFHLIGSRDQETIRWQFKAGEPYLRRSYSDETIKLVELLKKNLAGTSGLPQPEATIAPGYSLVRGKHSDMPKLSSTNVALPAVNGGSKPQPKFQVNLPLAIIAAGCAIALVIMLTRSVPVEDADV
jgi:hypothetical protein